MGQGDNHPGLYRNVLKIKTQDIHWVREDLKLSSGESKDFLVRIRYRQPLKKAKIFMTENGLYIAFRSPEKSIAKGQFAAWYTENELIGSGVIH